jgi:hypothetical protein
MRGASEEKERLSMGREEERGLVTDWRSMVGSWSMDGLNGLRMEEK